LFTLLRKICFVSFQIPSPVVVKNADGTEMLLPMLTSCPMSPLAAWWMAAALIPYLSLHLREDAMAVLWPPMLCPAIPTPAPQSIRLNNAEEVVLLWFAAHSMVFSVSP
jgi:hypothetical protein